MKKNNFWRNIVIIIFFLFILLFSLVPFNDGKDKIDYSDTICITIAAGLMLWKGLKLENFLRKRDRENSITFFDWYNIEINRMWKSKMINFYLFIPVFFKCETEELKKERFFINLITVASYIFAFLPFIISCIH